MNSKLIESILLNAGIDMDKISNLMLKNKNIKENNELENNDDTQLIDSPPSLNEPPTPESNICFCPLCKEDVNKDEFYGHMMNVHQEIMNIDNNDEEMKDMPTPKNIELQIEALVGKDYVDKERIKLAKNALKDWENDLKKPNLSDEQIKTIKDNILRLKTLISKFDDDLNNKISASTIKENNDFEKLKDTRNELLGKKDSILLNIETIKSQIFRNEGNDLVSLKKELSLKYKEYDDVKNEIKEIYKQMSSHNIKENNDLVKAATEDSKEEPEVKSTNPLPNNIKKDLNDKKNELLKKSKDLRNEDSQSAQDAQDLADVIDDILMHLEKGTMEEFKKAQVLTTSLKSGMSYNLPASFWKYISEYKFKDEEKNLKSYFNIVKAKEKE